MVSCKHRRLGGQHLGVDQAASLGARPEVCGHGRVRGHAVRYNTPSGDRTFSVAAEPKSIAQLALQLQGMRSGLVQYRTGARSHFSDAPELLSRLLDRYDAALVRAAVLLHVAVPGAPVGSERLGDEARAQLEHALRVAGLELDRPADGEDLI